MRIAVDGRALRPGAAYAPKSYFIFSFDHGTLPDEQGQEKQNVSPIEYRYRLIRRETEMF